MRYLIMLLGLAIIVLLLLTVQEESRARRTRAAELLHTDFVSPKKEIKPVHLRTTQVTIGRLPINDICLQDIDPENRISRTHCVLWWAGTHFRIKPKYTTRLKKGKLKKSRPVVRVNGTKASARKGLAVGYGDTIDICGHYFTLVNTAPERALFFSGQVPARDDPQTVGGRKTSAGRTGKRVGKIILVLTSLILAVCVAVGAWSAWVESPAAEEENPIGQRKDDTAAILICGTDREGDRTDTIMLCVISGEDRKLSLLSIPRDLRTTNSMGKTVRINAIYGNRGADGMEDLMDNVAMFTGYRPDGYVVFDWQLVKDLVDHMGGVDVHLDHHIRVHTDGVEVYVPEGDHHLDGEMALAALRYRAGYVNADIGRVEVQRIVVKACLEQWVRLGNLPKLMKEAQFVLEESLTDLTIGNVVWMGQTFLSCGGDLELNEGVIKTAPVYIDGKYKGERAVQDDLLEMLNEDFNPFCEAIEEAHLNITQ